MIPCDKCLKYPICRHMKRIYCDALFNHVWEVEYNIGDDFPELVYLEPEPKKH